MIGPLVTVIVGVQSDISTRAVTALVNRAAGELFVAAVKLGGDGSTSELEAGALAVWVSVLDDEAVTGIVVKGVPSSGSAMGHHGDEGNGWELEVHFEDRGFWEVACYIDLESKNASLSFCYCRMVLLIVALVAAELMSGIEEG